MPQVLTDFLVALQFLTVSPAFIRRVFEPQELGRSTAFFPLVGALAGALLLGASLLLSAVFPPLVRAGLVLALWVGLSGALHLDGFLDACDGLLGGFTPESRLEIMRDERIGAFALAGGFLLLVLKFAALSHLAAGTPALLVAPVLGRWAAAVAIYATPYARPSGLGRAMKDHTGRRQALTATVLMLLLVLLAGGWRGLAAVGLAGVLLFGLARFTLQRIPGLTGDLYGAAVEVVELGVLLLFVAHWRV